ncbi:MAG: Asp-tRNA(Asn)/Glu-tRNA(Gln) amidotransferase subunit GatB [Patescibacteria group bacterium]|mgnify:CR=1 FL=1
MSKYIPVIGLEIHTELKTRTKMFCDSLNNPEEKHPNTNVCPICLGHPGTLPVPNKSAIEAVIKVGMALKGDTPQFSKFDRKNYFYPDLPKGYQISQYDLPLVFGGNLNGVRITRVHLEEDTARLMHAEDGAHSLVDFNRAGVPLMELVTEPDIRNAEDAVQFAKELQLLLRYLQVSDADMERGQMRVEANISMGRLVDGEVKFGTKVEVKNINSFKAVQGAIEYETLRQTEALTNGETIRQETRGWNESRRATVSQRAKESAHDYRYFPEPDIPPLDLSRFKLGEIKASIPELPQEKRVRFAKEFALKADVIETIISDRKMAQFFEESVSELAEEDNEHLAQEMQLLANYLTSDVRGMLIERGETFDAAKLTPEHFADLIELISHKTVSSRGAKDVLLRMCEMGGDPHEILKSLDVVQVSDEGELGTMADRIIAAHPNAVEDFKKGKGNALQFLVGKAMAELKGKGNPEVLQKLFKERL